MQYDHVAFSIFNDGEILDKIMYMCYHTIKII